MHNKYVIYVNNQAISVSKEIYTEYWKSIEHERYLTKLIRKTWIYLDHLFDEYESNTLEYKLIQDKNPTRNEAYKMDKYEALHNAIKQLTEDEMDLIISLYFDGFNQTEYAKYIGKSQQTISKNHKKILKKLKKLINS
ncbi:sigma-70 family RNA polymerase sigma factor [Erysipelothrix anatis]|uniref:sigma-70 family RNA polymerase sigma factor n=1 Tax=Erysipelothrix anatis TaxID=2683713 RepID=UPI00135B9E7C|nr:sigma-70 family RNA polymerase sigma factor [Erysipelothrix anatis]